jgi:hypothetical protein
MHNYSAIFYQGVPLYTGTGQVESPARAGEMARLLGDAKALMLRGHGAVVVGQSIREVCMLALFLEESARLQTDAMRLGTPLFMERDGRRRSPNGLSLARRAGLGWYGQVRRYSVVAWYTVSSLGRATIAGRKITILLEPPSPLDSRRRVTIIIFFSCSPLR